MTFSHDRPIKMEPYFRLHTLVALDVAYVTFCWFLGPRLMRKRNPFPLTIPGRIYNLAQIAINLLMFYSCFSMLGIELFNCWSNVCEPITTANIRPIVDEQIIFTYTCYYFNKMLDLLDTVFLVLRKRTAQITIHHIFHHSSMVICSHLTAYYLADEEINMKMISINAFVHIILHLYYLMSSSGPSFQKYQYLKKYVMGIHLIELIMLLTMLAVKMVTCHSSITFMVMWTVEIVIQFGLFINFCRSIYVKKSKDY